MKKETFLKHCISFSCFTNLENFAVIDLLRILVLHPDGVAKLLQYVKDGYGN